MELEPLRNAFAAADVGQLCAELRALFPHDAELERVDELARFALSGGAFPQDVQESTRIFLESMARVAAHDRTGGWDRQPHRVLPCELDFLGARGGAEGWTIAQALNRLTLDRIKPARCCAVVGTMRDDGIYIMEWVAHWLALGFEHVFIYTNDNSDGSDELLALLAQHGIVTVMENVITGEVAPEQKAFEHALHLLHELRDYEWALFVDSDELLVPAVQYDYSVPSVLRTLREAAPELRVAGICYDWLWVVSDLIFERRPGLLCERFQHGRPHRLSKCLVRVHEVQSMRPEHHPEVDPGCCVVDSAFQPLDLETFWERCQPQYAGGRIHHYWPRSFQEFAVKKARGAALGSNLDLYNRPYEMFFVWNGYATSDNYHPTDLRLLYLIKNRIDYLRALDGVAAVADRIDQGFPAFLARIADEQRLRLDYQRCRVEPGDL